MFYFIIINLFLYVVFRFRVISQKSSEIPTMDQNSINSFPKHLHSSIQETKTVLRHQLWISKASTPLTFSKHSPNQVNINRNTTHQNFNNTPRTHLSSTKTSRHLHQVIYINSIYKESCQIPPLPCDILITLGYYVSLHIYSLANMSLS